MSNEQRLQVHLSSLQDTRKLQAAFDLRLPDWQVGVDRMLVEVLGQ